MEAEGMASELNWSSFDPSFSVEETEEAMAQLFGSQHMVWSDSDYDGCYSSNPDMAVTSTPMNSSIGGEGNAGPWFPLGAYDQHDRAISVNEETSRDELVDAVVKPLPPPPPPPPADASQGTKRRLRGGDIQIEVSRKKWKKAQNSAATADEEDSSADINPRSSYCYGSEDDSNGSRELKGAVSMSSSSKGSAALNPNPQSLYAKKRRERINERLRILQNLVPNGTKVDISTMLEEAVQYVKFLQLQIKLLSSDEMWMYAPIAYNGVSLGFDLKDPSIVSAEENDSGI
ncbi:unnamed protein product [Musa hybrid cultivar]